VGVKKERGGGAGNAAAPPFSLPLAARPAPILQAVAARPAPHRGRDARRRPVRSKQQLSAKRAAAPSVGRRAVVAAAAAAAGRRRRGRRRREPDLIRDQGGNGGDDGESCGLGRGLATAHGVGRHAEGADARADPVVALFWVFVFWGRRRGCERKRKARETTPSLFRDCVVALSPPPPFVCDGSREILRSRPSRPRPRATSVPPDACARPFAARRPFKGETGARGKTPPLRVALAKTGERWWSSRRGVVHSP